MRVKYPRPNKVRKKWQNLNGEWDFCFDKKYSFNDVKFDKKINVPFAYQSAESGIGISEDHDKIWYKTEFEVTQNTNTTMLHFGAVDYYCKVYLNGLYIGEHEGGSLPFSFNISQNIHQVNSLVVEVTDPCCDETIPRGKQFWQEEAAGIWYTKTSGIWQTVWLEFLNDSYIDTILLEPNVDKSTISLDLDIIGNASKLCVEIFKDGQILVQDEYTNIDNSFNRTFNLIESNSSRSIHGTWLWTPENPHLFDVKLKLYNNEKLLDEVDTYFGLRKVHVENGRFYLNNFPYYQRLVLDQGYWPTGLLTAPSDESFEEDITLSKKMGFNGCRKHQKVEDPQFLYECDRLGFLVWSEIPSAPIYTQRSISRMIDEYKKMIVRDYNHPSIIVWVCLNESWTTPKITFDKSQQAFAQSLYYMTKAFDKTRLSISNDGWSITETDICAIHNYNHGNSQEFVKHIEYEKNLDKPEDLLKAQHHDVHPVYAEGYTHNPETPIMLTEFGGIGLVTENEEGSGYTNSTSVDQYIQDLARIMKVIYKSESIYGFCYTQLTDVEQEKNGFLHYDRSPKLDFDIIKNIIENKM